MKTNIINYDVHTEDKKHGIKGYCDKVLHCPACGKLTNLIYSNGLACSKECNRKKKENEEIKEG